MRVRAGKGLGGLERTVGPTTAGVGRPRGELRGGARGGAVSDSSSSVDRSRIVGSGADVDAGLILLRSAALTGGPRAGAAGRTGAAFAFEVFRGLEALTCLAPALRLAAYAHEGGVGVLVAHSSAVAGKGFVGAAVGSARVHIQAF